MYVLCGDVFICYFMACTLCDKRNSQLPLGEKKTATVLHASDDGVDVEIDDSTTLRYIESNAFIAYLSPKTRIEKVKIKNEYTIAQIEK